LWEICVPVVFPHTVSPAATAIPFALDDDADGTGSGGSLTTAATSVVHLTVVIGPIVGFALGTPRPKRVSCIVPLPLTIGG
jgi:hypothetical protein